MIVLQATGGGTGENISEIFAFCLVKGTIIFDLVQEFIVFYFLMHFEGGGEEREGQLEMEEKKERKRE